MSQRVEGGVDPAARALAEAMATAPAGSTLVWGRRVADLAQAIAPDRGIRWDGFSDDIRSVHSLQGRGITCGTGVAPPEGRYDRVALLMPRAKEVLTWRVAAARSRLTPGGTIWIAGHGRDGIKSVARQLRAAGSVAVVHTKYHCRVIALQPEGQAATSEAPPSARFEVEVGPRTIQCETLAGVFAHGRLDGGSACLLAHLPEAHRVREALDLGCGGGVLAAALLALQPEARVTLCDVSAVACEAARRTLDLNGFEGHTVLHAALDGIPRQPPRQLVLCNPPFHDGRQEDRTQIETFVRVAHERLQQGGQLLLVANAHLGYARALEARFRRVQVVGGDGRFKVWSAFR